MLLKRNHDSSLAVGVPNPSTRDRCAFGCERVGLPTQVLSPFFGRDRVAIRIPRKQEECRGE